MQQLKLFFCLCLCWAVLLNGAWALRRIKRNDGSVMANTSSIAHDFVKLQTSNAEVKPKESDAKVATAAATADKSPIVAAAAATVTASNAASSGNSGNSGSLGSSAAIGSSISSSTSQKSNPAASAYSPLGSSQLQLPEYSLPQSNVSATLAGVLPPAFQAKLPPVSHTAQLQLPSVLKAKKQTTGAQVAGGGGGSSNLKKESKTALEFMLGDRASSKLRERFLEDNERDNDFSDGGGPKLLLPDSAYMSNVIRPFGGRLRHFGPNLHENARKLECSLNNFAAVNSNNNNNNNDNNDNNNSGNGNNADKDNNNNNNNNNNNAHNNNNGDKVGGYDENRDATDNANNDNRSDSNNTNNNAGGNNNKNSKDNKDTNNNSNYNGNNLNNNNNNGNNRNSNLMNMFDGNVNHNLQQQQPQQQQQLQQQTVASMLSSYSTGMDNKINQYNKQQQPLQQQLPSLYAQVGSQQQQQPQQQQLWRPGGNKFSPVDNVLRFANMLLYKVGMDGSPFHAQSTQVVVNPNMGPGFNPLPNTNLNANPLFNAIANSGGPTISISSSNPFDNDDFDTFDYFYNTLDAVPPLHPPGGALAGTGASYTRPFGFQPQYSVNEQAPPFNFLENALDLLLGDEDAEDELEMRCPVHHDKKSAVEGSEHGAAEDAKNDLIQVCSCRLIKKQKKTA